MAAQIYYNLDSIGDDIVAGKIDNIEWRGVRFEKVREGRWFEAEQENFLLVSKYYVCSECNRRYNHNWPYCPHCGAKMENAAPENDEEQSHWISLGHQSGFLKHPYSEDFKCSNCGYEQYTIFNSPPDICPHCGQKMNGEGEEDETD